MKPLITLKNVTRSYVSNGINSIGLEDVSFHVNQGEIVTLIGPSGCGKTTILRIIANILEPSNGEVLYDGGDIALARKNNCLSYISQAPSLFPNRNVYENINLPMEIRSAVDADKVKALIKLVNLEGFEKYYPQQLSGGMKQKVALSRSLVFDPKVLLMDEPFSSLDELTRERLDFELLKIYYELKPTIIFVTHNIEEAVFISNRVLIMSDAPGKILYDLKIGLPDKRYPELKSEYIFFEEVRKIREKIKKL